MKIVKRHKTSTFNRKVSLLSNCYF